MRADPHIIGRLSFWNFDPPGDPLISRVTGGSGLLSATSPASYAKRATDAWLSPTMNDTSAAVANPVSFDVPGLPSFSIPDALKRGGAKVGFYILGAVLLVLALYLLARGN